MKLSIRVEDGDKFISETETNSFTEAKDVKPPVGKAFLIECHHDEAEYKPCRKIPIEEL